MKIDDATSSRNAEDAALTRKFRRHFESGTPADALTWNSSKQRSDRMFAWRIAVSNAFSNRARAIRVAWLLDSLCLKHGFAFATDTYLGNTLGLQVNNVQAALSELEQAGAIIRASLFVQRRTERRIWPSSKIIPLTVRGIHTPHRDSPDTPYGKGTDSIGKTEPRKTYRISSTADAARRQAELRELRSGTGGAERHERDGTLPDAAIDQNGIDDGGARAPHPRAIMLDAAPDGLNFDQDGNCSEPAPDRRPEIKTNMQRGREMLQ